MLYELIPTMPEHRLRPLVERFAYILAEQPVFSIHPAETAAQVRLGFGDGLRAHFLASLSTAWVRASTSGSVGSKWPPTHSSLSACSSWSGSAIASRNSP